MKQIEMTEGADTETAEVDLPPVERAGRRLRSAPAVLAVAAIRAYQIARSGHPSPCRFTPTCSQYALEAVGRHGARRGLYLAMRRLGRCRPRGPFGYDPIPE